ncbi:enoyl-CoA hydratase [Tardibacter chloracetimidivorans]|uniref:Enoyl-CoA hydratase n=1 Tax=Tardibacter chloracetimidivorans TaxID=1921510 RepID=A0A1L3ZW93_9SPHN|nr:enoyl-CoA hydratase-related protein [Tardibacter chloracetimidivorans]API59901.1 enoyl-CoA hydratase [Tardibacter chloracetimidivorans]
MRIEDYQTIRFQRRGRALYVIFNQPDSRNAFAAQSHTELSHVFETAALDAESDIVVVTGEGHSFSAGGNVPAMRANHESPELMYAAVREAKRVVRSMLECDKPIVAKINGDSIGLGATVALLADVAIATNTSRIADPHNAVALIAGDGGSVIWPQLIGFGRARHYLLTGDRITGSEAANIGLIYKSVEAAELDATVDAYVDRLLELPARSLRWTKETYTLPLKQLATLMMDTGMAYEAVSAATQDHLEAITAFEQKRKPRFNTQA